MCKQVMYAEIPYEVKEAQLITPCPFGMTWEKRKRSYYLDNGKKHYRGCYDIVQWRKINVGNIDCMNCKYYVGEDRNNQIVKCNHPKILE